LSEITHTLDPKSETWRALLEYAKQRLACRRGNLEATGYDLAETENQRGAIEELKLLIELGEPGAIIAPTPELDDL